MTNFSIGHRQRGLAHVLHICCRVAERFESAVVNSRADDFQS